MDGSFVFKAMQYEYKLILESEIFFQGDLGEYKRVSPPIAASILRNVFAYRRSISELRNFLLSENRRLWSTHIPSKYHELFETIDQELGAGLPARLPRLALLERALPTSADYTTEDVEPVLPPDSIDPTKSDTRRKETALDIEVCDWKGDPIEGAEVEIKGVSKGITDADGYYTDDTIKPGTYIVRASKSGHLHAESKTRVEQNKLTKIRIILNPAKAQLVWPENKAKHQQYVNLDPDKSSPENGSKIKIRFRLKDGKPGDKVYIKLDFDEDKVSKRNKPVRSLIGGIKADWCPKGGKELTLKSAGQEHSVIVELGLAGGDTYTISVGGTKKCEDESCTITNWRKLWYEIMAPELMGLNKDLGAQHRARIDKLLLPSFIKYRVWKAHIFPKSAAPKGTVFKASYFNQSGRDVFVLTDHTFTLYPKEKGKWDKGKKPRSIGLRLCDRNYFNDRGISVVSARMRSKKGLFSSRTHLNRRRVLPWSANNGSQAVKRISWTAVVDPKTHPKHPALLRGKPRTGTIPTGSIEFKNISSFVLTLPEGTESSPGPGRFAGPESASTCPIRVSIRIELADAGLGMAGQGAQSSENLVCYGHNAPESTGDVLIHELCHSAGMAVIGKNKPPPGISQPKTTSEVDAEIKKGDKNPPKGPLGHLYTGKGHSGGHCARGLTDKQKAGTSYVGLPGTCINFGETGLRDPSAKSDLVCESCAIVLRARKLTSI